VCQELTASPTIVSYDLKTLIWPGADSSYMYANAVAKELHLYTIFICFATNVCMGNVFAAWIVFIVFSSEGRSIAFLCLKVVTMDGLTMHRTLIIETSQLCG